MSVVESRGNYVLGLDLGVSSIGWALLRSNGEQTSPEELVAAGVRVFDAGVSGSQQDIESGKDQPSGVERREARQRRRQAERRARRKSNLACLLRRHGLLPPEVARQGAKRDTALRELDLSIHRRYSALLDTPSIELQQLPYFLRARALDHKLELHEFGRALYHLGQRRGYKSNRKDTTKAKDDDLGQVEANIKDLVAHMEAAGARTLGEYLSHIDPVTEQRLRKRWTARSMYEAEFDALWTAQSAHYPKLLHDTLKREIHDYIFHQRPLRSQKGLVGKCDLEKGEYRAPKGLLIAQRFRMLQKANDLRICHEGGYEEALSEEQRKALLQVMDQKEKVSFAAVRKALKVPKDTELNLERGGEKELPGNKTAARLREIFGARWDAFPPDQKNALVGEVMGVTSPETMARRGRDVWGLSPEAAEQLAKLQLEAGYAGLSREAMRRLLPLMEQGVAYSTARDEIYGGQWSKNVCAELGPVEDTCPSIRNPAVMRTLTELRRVVNGVIRKYGKPDRIRVELARDLKKTREQRKEVWTSNRKRQGERDKFRELIGKQTGNTQPSRRDLERVQLWKECNETCPYTGQHISLAQLLSPESPWDVEHIIPFSRCLDDSILNKTLCYHEENRNRKKNQSPWEAYGSTEQWDAIIQRVTRFSGDVGKEKLRRFQLRDLKDFDDFVARQLNDTRYASRLAAQYLSWLYGDEAPKHIQVSAGGVTAYLRNAWNLNKILGDGGEKERGDHRHHAVDAVAIALTERKHVKALSDAAARQWARKQRSQGFQKNVELPWDGFLADVQRVVDDIVVSHRPTRKISGCLHDDSIYSPPRTDADGASYVVMRRPLDASFAAATLDAVVDPGIRRILAEHLEAHGGDTKKAFGDPANHPAVTIKIGLRRGQRIPIHRVRLRMAREVTAIGNDETQRHVWTRGNSHIEIFALKDSTGAVKKWEGRVVSRLEAYRRMKQKEPVVNRAWDDAHEFLFSLTQGDIVELDVAMPNGEIRRELYVVRGVANQLSCTHIRDARKKADIPKVSRNGDVVMIQKVPYANTLNNAHCRKVQVSPLGSVHPAHD